MSECQFSPGFQSKFSLPKLKMADNKYQRQIKNIIAIALYSLDYKCFAIVLVWGNGWNKDIQRNIERKFGVEC